MVLAEFTPNSPRGEAVCDVQLPVLFFPCSPERCNWEKMPSEGPVCEAVLPSPSVFMQFPEMVLACFFCSWSPQQLLTVSKRPAEFVPCLLGVTSFWKTLHLCCEGGKCPGCPWCDLQPIHATSLNPCSAALKNRIGWLVRKTRLHTLISHAWM